MNKIIYCEELEFPNNNGHLYPYFVYNSSEEELEKYIGKWFKLKDVFDKNGKLISRTVATVISVDEKTSWRLYNDYYHTFSINISPTWWKAENDKQYNMIAHIWSIDDGSYSVWFNKFSVDTLEFFKEKIMEYISFYPLDINGDDFVEFCKSLHQDIEVSYD